MKKKIVVAYYRGSVSGAVCSLAWGLPAMARPLRQPQRLLRPSSMTGLLLFQGQLVTLA